MPAPTAQNLIKYTEQTGKLYPSIRDDEHYFKETGQRVPWYKEPKKPTPGQKVKHIKDTRELERLTTPPTQQELEKAETERLKTKRDLSTEQRDTRLAEEAREKERLGPTLLETTLRQTEEQEELKEQFYTPEFLAAKKNVEGKLVGKAGERETLKMGEPELEDYRPPPVIKLIDEAILSKRDSVRMQGNAQTMGYTHTKDFYSDRNKAVKALFDYNKIIKELGSPDPKNLTPEQRLRLQEAGVNYPQALGFLNESDK